MRIPAFLLACTSALVPLQSAYAANDWILVTNDQLLNSAVVEMEGDANRLEVTQEHSGGDGTNRISISVEGSFNGGPLNAEFTGAALLPGLAPGTLTQRGYNNSMSFGISGSHNLLAAAQIGNGNAITGSVTGSYNQASILQSGNNNFVAFSQNGIGNTVSVTQTSW